MSFSKDLCWLQNETIKNHPFKNAQLIEVENLYESLKKEITYFLNIPFVEADASLVLQVNSASALEEDGFTIETADDQTIITAKNENGLLYGFYHLVRLLQQGDDLTDYLKSEPTNKVRMINHWDNFDGSVERGYAGRSIFFEGNQFRRDDETVRHYARLLASVGINALTINNVNVHKEESYFITDKYLGEVAHLADIFRLYGIRLFLSVNFASPMEVAKLETADPLDQDVQRFWTDAVDKIYQYMPDFGGFVVKADSENRPGPFTYNRTHADGANMLGKSLKKYGGIVFWRCFVYNNHQDWRDRTTDRARAAYDHFKPLDGQFDDNVILQIKNGPMDFQVREAVSPLFGALEKTNQVLEFQIAQEYTGQQKHIFYLVPQWKEVLDFDTYKDGKGSTVQTILNHYPEQAQTNGITAVVNVGRDDNWTGHKLAQANLYGYGRLIWNPTLTAEEILEEWLSASFDLSNNAKQTLKGIMLSSWDTYEKYTSPLGIGWMVEPNHHYGPNIDGYEYSMWGTYHFSDHEGLGVDRTVASGTGYSRQYHEAVYEQYENVETCPEELLLFFHHLPYTHQLKTGKTIIQHIYDTHFEGYEAAESYQKQWESLKDELDPVSYENVKERLVEQVRCAREWRDQVNTYYFRKSGIADEKNRKIYS